MDIKESFEDVKEKIVNFFTFIADKLKNFKNLSLGEQIAYCCVGIGFILIIVSLIMFIVM